MLDLTVIRSPTVANRVKEETMGAVDYDRVMEMLNTPIQPEKPQNPTNNHVEALVPGEELEGLTRLAVLRTHQVLQPEIDLSDEKLTRLQMTAAQGVLHLQAKVDEGRLKRRKLDVLPRLIELIREEQERRAREERQTLLVEKKE
jgi:hypothetical protein